MEVGGQFHVPSCFTVEYELPLPTKKKERWAPDQVRTLQDTEKYLAPTTFQTSDQHSCSLVIIHNSDYAIPGPVSEALNITYTCMISVWVPTHKTLLSIWH